MRRLYANVQDRGRRYCSSCGAACVLQTAHAELPEQASVTIVWATNVSAVGTATTWLQRQGLAVIERGFLANIFEMENLDLTYTLQDEAMGIREVVLVDRGGDGRGPMISVRGV